MENEDPPSQADCIKNIKIVFEQFLEKKQLKKGKLKIPFSSNYGRFMEATFSIFNTKNNEDIDRSIENMSMYLEFMKIIEEIFFPETYMIYFNRIKYNKLISPKRK